MTAAIWYFPEVGGTLEQITLAQAVWSDIQELPGARRAEVESVGGVQAVSIYAHPMRVRFVARFYGLDSTGLALAQKLHTLQNHLDRGGMIFCSNVTTKAWAGYSTSGYPRGATSIAHSGLAWGLFTSATLAQGDELVIQSFAPACKREYANVSALGSSTLTLSSPGLTFGYADSFFVRHRDFYVGMRFPTGERREILSHDRRNVYTLDMTLEEDLPSIEAGTVLSGGGALATSTVSAGKLSPSKPASFSGGVSTATGAKPVLGASKKGRS
jgi:hypothetical protein